MTSNPIPIDISHMPDLMRLAGEVEVQRSSDYSNGIRRLLQFLIPVKPTSKKQQVMKEALELAESRVDRDWDDVEAELDRIRKSSENVI